MRFPLVLRSALTAAEAGRIKAIEQAIQTGLRCDALQKANDSLGANLTNLLSERDYLRSQLRDALEHARRLDRIDRKVSETPITHRQPMEPIPDDIVEMLKGWPDDTRTTLEAQAKIRRARDGHWDGVRAEMTASAG